MSEFTTKFMSFMGFTGDQESGVNTTSSAEAFDNSLIDDVNDDDVIIYQRNTVKKEDNHNSKPIFSKSGSTTSSTSATSRASKTYGEEKKKIVTMPGSQQGLKVVLSNPTAYSDCPVICSHLREKMTIVLNLENAKDAAVRKSIFDFVSGCCYALDGNLQKVSEYIYVVAPNNVDVFADIADDKADGKTLFD